jgi:hypothetical protein
MVVQLATVKQERNAAILKVIKKDGAIKRSSEQLHSVYRTLVLSSFSSARAFHDSSFLLVLQRSRLSWSSLELLGSKLQSP